MARPAVFSDDRSLVRFVEEALSSDQGTAAFKRIVSAVAGDDTQAAVVEWTAALAKIGDADVTLVRAYGRLPSVAYVPDATMVPVLSPEETEIERRNAAYDVEVARERLGRSGIQASTDLLESDPALAIESAARTSRAQLIVVGDGRKSGWRRFLEGSISNRVQDAAQVPTLVARGSFDGRHVLVAVDGSPESAAALRVAFRLASAWGSQVSVLSIEEQGTPPRGASRAPYQASLRGKVAVAFALVGGVPADEIVDFAQEHQVSLVVMGTRGLGPIARAFVDSVSREVARRTRASVLVVRSPRIKVRRVLDRDD